MNGMMCKNGKSCCNIGMIFYLLLLVGGINWGLVGLGGFFGANWNVVNLILGSWPMVEWAVYVLVGVGAIMTAFGCKCAKCRG